MANTNLYDRPVASQFIDTYVPIPFQEIAQAGAARQGRYDVTARGLDELYDATQALTVIPGSSDEIAKKEYIIPIIEGIRDKYMNKDLSSSLIRRQMSKELETKIDKPLVMEMEAGYRKWEEDRKLIQEYKNTGNWHPILEERHRRMTEGYSTAESGVYSGGVEPYIDPTDEIDELFETNEWLKGQTYRGKDGQLLHYRDSTDVDSIADAEWSTLSPNAQRNALLDFELQNLGADMNDPAIQEEAIKERIRERGDMTHTFGVGTAGWQTRTTTLEEGERDPRTPVNPVDIGRVIKMGDVQELKGGSMEGIPDWVWENSFDADGNLIPYSIERELAARERSKITAEMSGQAPTFKTALDVESLTVEESIDKRFTNQMKVVDNFRDRFPQYGELNDADAYRTYKGLLHTMNNRGVNHIMMGEAASVEATNMVLKNLTSREIVVVDAQGNIKKALIGAKGRNDVFKKELGVDFEGFKAKLKEIGAGGYSNDISKPMMLYFDGFVGKNGEVYTVYISGSTTQQQYGQISHDALKAYISLDGEPVPMGNEGDPAWQKGIPGGQRYYMLPDYSGDPMTTTNPKFKIGTMSGGSFIPTFVKDANRGDIPWILTLSQIQNSEILRMEDSNIIETDINRVTGAKTRDIN